MESNLRAREGLIEDRLIDIHALGGAQDVHVVGHGDLEQRAGGVDTIDWGGEFVAGAADVGVAVLRATRRFARRAGEGHVIEQRGFGVRDMGDLVHRNAKFVAGGGAGNVQLTRAHADHVRERGRGEEQRCRRKSNRQRAGAHSADASSSGGR